MNYQEDNCGLNLSNFQLNHNSILKSSDNIHFASSGQIEFD